MTHPAGSVPTLVPGDRLTRDEFERRYAAMPLLKKAELVEGVVYVPSPVTHARHGGPHFLLSSWAGLYVSETPGTQGSDNATVRLDLDNEPQPDLLLRILPECGGRTSLSPEGYLEGSPELVVEITASRASYDLHDKLRAYRRNGVQEYLVWRVDDAAFDWFVLRGGSYERMPDTGQDRLRSAAFPGLWLDGDAALRDDLRAVRATLQRGLSSPEHAAFTARLAAARARHA